MKKPLLVILIIGLIPILLLLIGLFNSKKVGDNQTDNYNYPQTDNVLLYADQSKQKVTEFFNMAGKDLGVIDLFKDQTIDQLRYDNIYHTSLTVALENISFIKLNSIESFEPNSWTAQDHMYLVSYQLTLSEQTYSFLGSNGTNEKILLLVRINDEWRIADFMDIPTY